MKTLLCSVLLVLLSLSSMVQAAEPNYQAKASLALAMATHQYASPGVCHCNEGAPCTCGDQCHCGGKKTVKTPSAGAASPVTPLTVPQPVYSQPIQWQWVPAYRYSSQPVFRGNCSNGR